MPITFRHTPCKAAGATVRASGPGPEVLICDSAVWSKLRARFACAQHDLGQTAAKVSGTVRHVMEQPGLSELREDLKDFKRRAEAQIESVTGELAIVKNCIMQLYNVLLPGKFAMQPLPQPQPLQMVSSTHYGAPQHPGHPHLAAVRAAASHTLLQTLQPVALPFPQFGASPLCAIAQAVGILKGDTTELGSECPIRAWTLGI